LVHVIVPLFDTLETSVTRLHGVGEQRVMPTQHPRCRIIPVADRRLATLSRLQRNNRSCRAPPSLLAILSARSSDVSNKKAASGNAALSQQ
jgi:hypothetical protein